MYKCYANTHYDACLLALAPVFFLSVWSRNKKINASKLVEAASSFDAHTVHCTVWETFH